MSLPSVPISIQPSSSELEDGALSQKNLEIATRALHRDGLVVLEDLVPHEILDKLNKKMVEDAYKLQGKKDSPFNYHKGNIQQDPLLTEELFFEEVFVSEFPPVFQAFGRTAIRFYLFHLFRIWSKESILGSFRSHPALSALGIVQASHAMAVLNR
jgi:hypothetical protein